MFTTPLLIGMFLFEMASDRVPFEQALLLLIVAVILPFLCYLAYLTQKHAFLSPVRGAIRRFTGDVAMHVLRRLR